MEITSTGISLDAPKLITGGKEYSYVKEGFKVEEYISPRYGYEDDGWKISWDLKEGEVQYE